MPKHEFWPHEAELLTNKGATFEERTFTISEFKKPLDGISKTSGKPYHFPPRIIFVEDPTATEWQWKVWEKDGKKVDKPADPSPKLYPAFGERVKAKLKIAEKNNGEYFYDIVRLTRTGEGVPPDVEPERQPEQYPEDKFRQQIADSIDIEDEGSVPSVPKEPYSNQNEKIGAAQALNLIVDLYVADKASSVLLLPDHQVAAVIRGAIMDLCDPPALNLRYVRDAIENVIEVDADIAKDDLTNKTGEDEETLPW
jgi:hypothetical protein